MPCTGVPIKVMVVDDSAVVRSVLTRWIDEHDEFEAVSRCMNGKVAVDRIVTDRPDVVLLDIEMPVMSGLTAIPLLLEKAPDTKILIVSTLSTHNAELSMKAMSLGATDYIPKPDNSVGLMSNPAFRRELVDKIKAVANHKTASGKLSRLADMLPSSPVTSEATRPFSAHRPGIIAIGSSTGGPRALDKVLPRIANAISDVPVVLTQHMPRAFTALLAKKIATQTGRPTFEGEDGMELKAGSIYIAPGGRHMSLRVQGDRVVVAVEDGAEINFCKPSVEPLLASVAKIFGSRSLVLILTGMGSDGAEGATRIANTGGSVIAQDKASSVVWGMPGAVVKAGAASAVLPLDRIAPKIISLLGKNET
jgi:two-component system chemotaxis response regulator CheB